MNAESVARAIRAEVLRQSHRAHVGHIGSALSIADIIAVLFTNVLPGTNGAERDGLILSKGHAALALYAALHLDGVLSDSQLATYCSDGGLLGVHPEIGVPGIELSTGSLGQGLSVAAGRALAWSLSGSTRRSYVVMSDAELNEGSVWEAVMFAGHHHLDNLVAIVDCNGQQALGCTRDVIDLGTAPEIAAKMRAFGWDADVVDGHSCAALDAALLASHHGRPRMIVAETDAGHGVSFMERQVAWHYLPMTDPQYEQAMLEVAG